MAGSWSNEYLHCLTASETAMDERLSHGELKEFLEEYYEYFNRPSFIASDPIQIPHRYSRKEDIEIAGFLTAIIAWGQRPVIIRNASSLLETMPDGPFGFLTEASDTQLESFLEFKHRTFTGTDCVFFLRSLRNIYRHHNGLEGVFNEGFSMYENIPGTIRHFRQVFFSIPFPGRSLKHIPDLDKNAAAKRINMFLRWMVRNDGRGVDFGIWHEIPSSALYIPLDLHTGKIARELGLLRRTYDDWKAVSELTHELRKFDSSDPVRFDFALFGLGALSKELT
jgi:uncharacterized protein (TIGR02757 family)